ncbi:single-stranded DNA-binding protein [Synergistales bacterium]|nr:single-stranded DNA-binding protein [Synergistales bacterium]
MATRGFNKVVLMGNLARDPEIRYTVDKRAWVRFTVACGYSYKNKNGEYQNDADFIPVTVWGSRAEFCARYLKKGSSVLVEGKISVRSYEAKDGSGKKYSTDVVAFDVLFAGSKRDSESGSGSFGGGERGGDEGFPGFPGDANFGKSIREEGFGGKGIDDGDFDFGGGSGSGGDDPEPDIPF